MPGIYDVPENANTNFSQSLNRIKAGINKSQVAQTQTQPTIGGSFPYEPGDAVHFLESRDRIGLGCKAEIYGGKHRLSKVGLDQRYFLAIICHLQIKQGKGTPGVQLSVIF